MSHASSSRTTSHQPLTTRFSRREKRSAFTLTELLVVIAIIAVLAAMVSVAVVRALDTAKQTRIKTEIDQIDMAMKAYREKYGSYPPSMFIGGVNAFRAHIAQAFPRYANLSDNTKFFNDLKAAGIDTTTFRPDQALVFWLQGFSPDPANPFVTPNNTPTAVAGAQIVNGAPVNPTVKVAVPLFDFDATRLAAVDSDTPNPNNANGLIRSYFPQGVKADNTGAPYLYWGSELTAYGNPPTMSTPDPPTFPRVLFNELNMAGTRPKAGFVNAGTAQHYGQDDNGNGVFDNDIENWCNRDSYQIISSGMDGKYGVQLPNRALARARLYPTGGVTYDIAGSDDDNVTNFCGKARLGDAKP